MFAPPCRPSDRQTSPQRRALLQVGALGGLGLTLPAILKARAESPAHSSSRRCRAVILVWLDGGVSQLETYDPKPQSPIECRGPLNAIASSMPGVQFGEAFPRQARLMDKVSLVRSVTHKSGDHFYCAHWVLTGFESRSNGLDIPDRYPSAGSIVAKSFGRDSAELPPYVAIPYAFSFGHRPGYHGGAYLGTEFDPLETVDEPQRPGFRVPNLTLNPQLTLARLEDRHELLAGLDRWRRRALDDEATKALDTFQGQAADILLSSRAARAFDLNAESPAMRDRYGRHLNGQSALLARRLVEAGVPFVTIHSGGLGGWDHHSKIQEGLGYVAPYADQAVAALIDDLDDRGLLDEVLVWVTGDLGRTPKMNADAGRDHWGVMSVLLAGGGCRRGNVVGATNSRGEYATRDRTSPADVLATIYHLLGIDLASTFVNRAGRPIPIANDGQVIPQLL